MKKLLTVSNETKQYIENTIDDFAQFSQWDLQ